MDFHMQRMQGLSIRKIAVVKGVSRSRPPSTSLLDIAGWQTSAIAR